MIKSDSHSSILDLYQNLNLWDPKLELFDIHKFETSMGKVIKKTNTYRNYFYQVSFFKGGRTLETITDKTYDIKKPCLFFSGYGHLKHWEIKEKLYGFVLFFKGEFISLCPENGNVLKDFPFFANASDAVIPLQHQSDINLLSELCEKMMHYYRQPCGSEYLAIIQCYLNIYLNHIKLIYQKTLKTECVDNARSSLMGRYQSLIDQHFERLHRHEPTSLVKVKDFAEELNVHPNYLNEVVSRQAGISASELFFDRTIQEAKSLLCQTELTSSEIAYRLNFTSPSYFYRFFKSKTGITPADFRKKSI